MAGISKAEREQLAEVKNKFESVELDDARIAVVDTIRKSFQKLAVELHRQLPEGRNKSLVFTNLEDASMRAVRAISHDHKEPVAADAVDEVVAEANAAGATEVAPKQRKPRAVAEGASKPRSRRAKETVDA